MSHQDFLDALIEDGSTEINLTYLQQDQSVTKDGCLKGFEICRGKTLDEIYKLWINSKDICTALREDEDPRLLYFTSYSKQIEKVLDVLCAKQYFEGKPCPIVPTSKAAVKMAVIVGMPVPSSSLHQPQLPL